MSKRVVLITGGSSGFGKAMAEKFAQNGDAVIITARHAGALGQVASAIGCDAMAMDVTNPGDWERLYQHINEKYGRIDILINNAGGGLAIKATVDQEIADIDQIIRLNLNSAIYGSRIFVPMMQRQHSGTIINFSSVCAHEAWPEWTVYAASKCGVLGFSKGLYTEVQPYGIRVTCVLPGCCSTSFQKDSGIAEVEMDLKPEDVAQAVVDICNLPLHVVIEEMTVWGMNQVVIPL